jgi:hypothetical protein
LSVCESNDTLPRAPFTVYRLFIFVVHRLIDATELSSSTILSQIDFWLEKEYPY